MTSTEIQMSGLAPVQRKLLERIRASVASIFLPQVPFRPARSMFDGDPEQIRKERPLPTYAQTRFYQADIETAIHLADSGNLEHAAKLARGMRRDGTLGGVLSSRTGGLTRLPKMFRGTPDVLGVIEDRDDGMGLFQRMFGGKELSLLLGDGIVLGVGVGELVPLPDREAPVFVRLDPQFLRYQWSDDRWYYLSVGGSLPITPGDGRWILHTPGGYQAPWTNGLWPSLARAYVAKDHAFHYRENYSGKLANPARVAVSPQGASEAHKQSWFQKVMAWGVNTVFGLTPGYDVKLLESNGRGYDVFQETIDCSDKEFMIGVAGQIVTVTGGAGFANADIHATIRTDLIQEDGDALAETLNWQGLRPVINRLFGGAARGTVKWDTRPPQDLNSEATAMSAAATAINDVNVAMAPYGMRADANEITKRARIPVLQIAAPAAPAAAQLGPAPAANDDAEPTVDAAQTLADKMTQHGVDRCEHGSSNRCRLCGVERTRDVVPGENGAPHSWAIGWRPLVAPGPVVASALRIAAKTDSPRGNVQHVLAYAFEERTPPKEIQLWNAGSNPTDYGVHKWTQRSIDSVFGIYNARGNPLLIDVEHNWTKDDKPDDEKVTGGYARLELRGGEPYLVFDWSEYGTQQIASGQKRFLSPEYDVDRVTGEIIRLYRVSLVADAGTHHARMLASAGPNQGGTMDIKLVIAALRAALAAEDPAVAKESITSLLAELDKMSGGDAGAGATDAAADDAAPPAVPAAAASDAPAAGDKDKAPPFAAAAPKVAPAAAPVAVAPAVAAAPAHELGAIKAASDVAVLAIENAQRDHLLLTEGDRLVAPIRVWASTQPLAVVKGLIGSAPARLEAPARIAATRGDGQGAPPTAPGLKGTELETLQREMGTFKASSMLPHETADGSLVLPTIAPRELQRINAAAAVAAQKVGK